MKIAFLLFFLSVSVTAYSQFDDTVDSLAFKHRIHEYKVINRKVDKDKSPLDNRVMKLKRFNEQGKLVYEYSFNVDVIYTIDSTLYKYNEKGNPVEMINYYIDYPTGKEQLNYIKELGVKIDTAITTKKYYYDSKDQLVKTEWFEFGKLSFEVLRYYDGPGRLVKEECHHFILPNENDYIATFEYDKDGKLVFQKELYPNDPKRVEEKSISYNGQGNILKEEKKGKWETSLVTHKYDEQGRRIEKIRQAAGMLSDGIFSYRYIYDMQGNLIEEKDYRGEELFNWEKYSYNKKGLLSEEFWMDEKTGKVSTSILYEYSFY